MERGGGGSRGGERRGAFGEAGHVLPRPRYDIVPS